MHTEADDHPDPHAPQHAALSAHLRTHATRHRASPELRATLRAQAALKTAARGRAGPARGWGRTAAGWTGGLVCGVALTLTWLAGSERLQPPPMTDSAWVAGHVLALGAGPLLEVASSDRHTVKPWFQGKLDYAPPVPELAAQGYPLLGGRVQPLQGHNVAALAYARQRHVLSVFIRPSLQVLAPQAGSERGFHLQHWGDGAMQVWVVSDMDAAEVARFGQAWRAAVTAQGATDAAGAGKAASAP